METMMILSLAQELLSFIGGSAVLSMLIPTHVKKFVPIIGKVLEICAGNALNAKNAD